MTTSEVANKMVELCRIGQIDEVQKTMYADDAVSVEANDSMGPKVVEGLNAIKAKSVAFQAGIAEFHGATISDPIVCGNSFAVTWVFDATFKNGHRMQLEEVCAYTVKDGKIVLEQFFY